MKGFQIARMSIPKESTATYTYTCVISFISKSKQFVHFVQKEYNWMGEEGEFGRKDMFLYVFDVHFNMR